MFKVLIPCTLEYQEEMVQAKRPGTGIGTNPPLATCVAMGTGSISSSVGVQADGFATCAAAFLLSLVSILTLLYYHAFVWWW